MFGIGSGGNEGRRCAFDLSPFLRNGPLHALERGDRLAWRRFEGGDEAAEEAGVGVAGWCAVGVPGFGRVEGGEGGADGCCALGEGALAGEVDGEGLEHGVLGVVLVVGLLIEGPHPSPNPSPQAGRGATV